MGACLSLYLARRRFDVTLLDAASAPLSGASRWNEGKIHLGYLYAADKSLETARRVLPGGLAFGPLIEDLIGGKLTDVTTDDDVYLVHRESVATAESMAAYFNAVSDLVREAPNARAYLADASGAAAHALSRGEIAAIADPQVIVAAFRAPERSVATVALADRLCAALAAEPRIAQRMGVHVDSARAVEANDGAWRVNDEDFDWVINALWHGRIAIDVTAGLAPEPGWSHRYRVSAFVRTSRPVSAPSAVVAVGPFGDIKNYNSRDFYLSWYPAGLLSESDAVTPPRHQPLDDTAKARISAEIERHLGDVLPDVRAVFAHAETIALEGGYVFAQGKGSLADPAATLHRRDRFGAQRRGRYISVDTGKYSTAPLMAKIIAAQIADA